MGFDVSADAYDQFMGRYSTGLAPLLADLAGVAAGQRVLDVGCGPGALTGVLVDRVGAASVIAVDPSISFVDAARARYPGVEVHQAGVEQLPLPDRSVDAALAQLVVHFLADPIAGLREMARVTRPGGVVAACVWDFAEGGGPLSTFWRAVHELDPDAPGEADLSGARRGHLAELFAEAGLLMVEDTALSARCTHHSFEEWWAPFSLAVGPAGAYVAALDDPGRRRLEERCRMLLPDAPIEVTATAWAARGSVGPL